MGNMQAPPVNTPYKVRAVYQYIPKTYVNKI